MGSGVQVAILCNHQRAVPKTHEKSMQAMDEKIEKAEENLNSLKKDLKLAKAGKQTQDGKNKSADAYAPCSSLVQPVAYSCEAPCRASTAVRAMQM